jgi:hypothetical protein
VVNDRQHGPRQRRGRRAYSRREYCSTRCSSEGVHEGTRHGDGDGEVVGWVLLGAAESGRLREDNRNADPVPIAWAG